PALLVLAPAPVQSAPDFFYPPKPPVHCRSFLNFLKKREGPHSFRHVALSFSKRNSVVKLVLYRLHLTDGITSRRHCLAKSCFLLITSRSELRKLDAAKLFVFVLV